MKRNKNRVILVIVSAIVLLGMAGVVSYLLGFWGHGLDPGTGPRVRRVINNNTQNSLVSFESDEELHRFMRRLAKAHAADERHRRRELSLGMLEESDQAAPPATAPDGESGGEESITNVQEAGIDEGGIVKVHGDFLVVLRRGRLFTIRIGDARLQPVSMVDAFPPGSSNDGWYDEMLVHRNTVIVVGFNYQRGGSELGLFDIDGNGRLRHRQTYYLRSNDYYSSRNYASRLMGDTFVFYMPYRLDYNRWDERDPDLDAVMPALSPHAGEWSSIVESTNIYQPIQPSPFPVLHTVVTCDLSSPEMSCTARGVVGPYSRSFYVSRGAVYLWVSGGRHGAGSGTQANAVLYRLPLGEGAPGALRVAGTPIDQFSFKESSDENLNVLVRAQSGGEGMWGAEVSDGDVALLRVPLSAIDASAPTASDDHYRALPRPEGYIFHNRFVGDHLLYGTGSGWVPAGADARGGRVFVHPYRTGGATATVALPHGVDRIEVMGPAAVVVGANGQNLHFSAIRLGEDPGVAGSYIQQDAAQGETRSHGFFYKPLSEAEGLLGLPIRRGGSPGYHHLSRGSAEILYLRVSDSQFARLGALSSRAGDAVEDNCVASCVDWYGNARPIFLRGRIFALLGYELVEGRLAEENLVEVARTNYYNERPER